MRTLWCGRHHYSQKLQVTPQGCCVGVSWQKRRMVLRVIRQTCQPHCSIIHTWLLSNGKGKRKRRHLARLGARLEEEAALFRKPRRLELHSLFVTNSGFDIHLAAATREERLHSYLPDANLCSIPAVVDQAFRIARGTPQVKPLPCFEWPAIQAVRDCHRQGCLVQLKTPRICACGSVTYGGGNRHLKCVDVPECPF